MTEDELVQFLARGHEVPGVEFKGPGPRTDRHLFARVVRAILGMANHRGGGLVIIGVDDHGSQLTPTGLSLSDVRSWSHEALAGSVSSYADPYVEIHTTTVQHLSRTFVNIEVQEFDEVPVLCKKDYPDVLRCGACYVRRRGRTETSEIPSHSEMRELLDLATEKRLRSFLGQAHRAGIAIVPPLSDDAQFDQEVEGFN